LEGPTRILKMRSQNASTATSTDIWQRNAERRRKNKKPGQALNMIRKNISPKTAKKSRR